jgi:glycosyltransferase involved in cell wall biosynthesis
MRIAVNGWFHGQLITGSGQYLEALAEWLPRVASGHEFIMIKRRDGEEQGGRGDREQGGGGEAQYAIPQGRFAVRTIHASTPFDHINTNLAKLWFEQITFPRTCRRLRADVAFVPYWGSPWWRPCPVVVTVHDLIPLLLPLYRGGLLQRAYTALVSRTARRAAAVLTDSEVSKRDLIAHLGIPAERVRTIHLAADPRFQPVIDPAELARTRAKYGLPEAPFLLYLGGFDARKNVGRMVEAYARMRTGARKQESGVRSQPVLSPVLCSPALRTFGVIPDPCPLPDLIIAGKLPAADTVFAPDPRPLAARLGVSDFVHFVGWVDEADKPALYSLALATVFVSEYEGFGLPVLEAMACEPVRSI